MIRALTRLFKPKSVRSFEGAAGGRRWGDLGSSSHLNGALFSGGHTLRRRAAHFGRNNPWAASGIRALVNNVIGAGIKPRSAAAEPAFRKAADQLFARWSAEADAAGRTDIFGLQSLAARGIFESGEAFLRFRPRLPEDNLAVPLQLEALDPEQVDIALHRNLPSGGQIRAGVEFDAIGRRVAYHLQRQRPGDVLPVAFDVVRVPAAFVLHVFEGLAPGQVRGATALASVLLRLHELDQYEDATAVGQKVRALYAGFIRDTSGDAAGYAGPNAGDLAEVSMEPGTIRVLPPGADITFSDPARGGGETFEAFTLVQLHAIAAGLGCTFEQMTGDLRQVNFSSARVGLLEFRRRMRALQQQVFIPQLCQPIWRRFIATAVLSGALEAPGFAESPERFSAVTWHAEGWDPVEPLKSAQAADIEMSNGTRSRAEVIAARGRDPEAVDAEIAEDRARAERLGLDFGKAEMAPAVDENEAEDAP